MKVNFSRSNRHDNSSRINVGNVETPTFDNILSTQPELAPRGVDGGYGWIIFLGTLFFQVTVPSLIVSFGIFLAFVKLGNIENDNNISKLWDDDLLYVPLFFSASWTLFDPISRTIIAHSSWPRLMSSGATCLICAGLVFMAIGILKMAGSVGSVSCYILSGTIAGLGASVQIAQCEILLAQYFKRKHLILSHVTQAVVAIGFILTPIVVGHCLLMTNIFKSVLWYQALILQGIVINLLFRKPMYLKSSGRSTAYNVIMHSPDDEEDILSKNSRELQIKRQDSTGLNVTIETHEVPTATQNEVNGTLPSGSGIPSRRLSTNLNNQYKNLHDWETFDDDSDEEIGDNIVKYQQENWEKFESEQNKDLKTELDNAEKPSPLFTETTINNNISYAYDDTEGVNHHQKVPVASVFAPNVNSKNALVENLKLMQEPTFYKSLILIITTKFSYFVFFTLFPSFLYQRVTDLKFLLACTFIGLLSFSTLLFALFAYWVNIDKRRRPICLWFMSWMGALGYFMLTDMISESAFIIGALLIVVSIATLQHVGGPLLGLTRRGETGREFGLISYLTGLSFMFFLFIGPTYKDCFRIMAVLHFITGSIWFSNFIYKKIKEIKM